MVTSGPRLSCEAIQDVVHRVSPFHGLVLFWSQSAVPVDYLGIVVVWVVGVGPALMENWDGRRP